MHGLLLVTALLTLAFLIYGLYQLNQRVMRLEEKSAKLLLKRPRKTEQTKRKIRQKVTIFS